MLVEICANGFESASNAQLGGADRIELCVDLSVGGLTPPLALIEKVRQELSIPIHVLVRPRAGDFVYNTQELQSILDSIEICNKIGCAGIVSGALDANGHLDRAAVKQMIAACGDMEFTFHRAIDVAKNPTELLGQLIELGATRVLSSGGETTAETGMKQLIELMEQARGRIEIMPGGGIGSHNAKSFLENGFEHLHLSAIKKPPSDSLFDNPVSGTSDLKEIQAVVQLLS